jgi:hypothetical protein
VSINQYVVTGYIGVARSDVAYAAHVSRQVINRIDASSSSEQATLHFSQVQDFEFVCQTWLVLGVFQINPSHPMTLQFQATHQMMSDEATGTRYKQAFPVVHMQFSFPVV